MKIIGLNLAVSKQSNTGFCILSEEVEVIKTLKSDEEIIGAVESFAPDIVAIATPLSFPEKGNWRKAEAELDKKKIKFTAPRGLISMEKLTLRGISLKEHFQNKGFLVIEVHAGAFCDLLKIPREKNYLHMKRLLKI